MSRLLVHVNSSLVSEPDVVPTLPASLETYFLNPNTFTDVANSLQFSNYFVFGANTSEPDSLDKPIKLEITKSSKTRGKGKILANDKIVFVYYKGSTVERITYIADTYANSTFNFTKSGTLGSESDLILHFINLINNNLHGLLISNSEYKSKLLFKLTELINNQNPSDKNELAKTNMSDLNAMITDNILVMPIDRFNGNTSMMIQDIGAGLVAGFDHETSMFNLTDIAVECEFSLKAVDFYTNEKKQNIQFCVATPSTA